MPLTLCVLLWSVDDQEGHLSAYEDEVLALVPEYGGTVLSRVRRTGGTTEQPYEVQVIELPGSGRAGRLPGRPPADHARRSP